MPFQSMEQGIKAIQAGNLDEGARLLRYALKDNQLTGRLRAVSYMWLAETQPNNNQFKMQCYSDALKADPNNPDVEQRLSALYASQLPQQQTPPAPPPSPPASPQGGQYGQQYNQPNTPSQGMPPYGQQGQLYNPQQQNTPPQGNQPYPGQQYNQPNTPPQGTPPYGQNPLGNIPAPLPTDSRPMQLPMNPYNPPPEFGDSQPMHPLQQQNIMQPTQVQYYGGQGFYRAVGIMDGPNGPGTGFFVTRDGLVATTRYVVGGQQNFRIDLVPGQSMQGRVVRAYPDLDLALIRLGMGVNQLLMVSNMPDIKANTPLVAMTYSGTSLRGTRRATQHQYPPHWFPTSIDQLADAGGNPVFDDRNFLVGMLTRNASRATGHVYGLHISMIYRCVEHYVQETNISPNRIYCPHCGYVSRAAEYQAFYCENCGGTLPHAVEAQRFQQPGTDALYHENMNQPCPHCGARSGVYNDQCLRCGKKVK